MIAISTGSVDALECVFRQMASPTLNSPTTTARESRRPHPSLPGQRCSRRGHQCLHANENCPDGFVNPHQRYDMLMFPCQGSPSNQATATGATNLLAFANSGGRIFATHYSYAWLEPASPYNSLFVDANNNGVANGPLPPSSRSAQASAP